MVSLYFFKVGRHLCRLARDSDIKVALQLRECWGFSHQFQGPEGSEKQGDERERSADQCHHVVSQRGEDKSAS